MTTVSVAQEQEYGGRFNLDVWKKLLSYALPYRRSVLVMESQPRLNDLSESDKTPIQEAQHALYFQSVPGRAYVVQSTDRLGQGWKVETVVTATTRQKRVVLDKPVSQAFYRIVVVP